MARPLARFWLLGACCLQAASGFRRPVVDGRASDGRGASSFLESASTFPVARGLLPLAPAALAPRGTSPAFVGHLGSGRAPLSLLSPLGRTTADLDREEAGLAGGWRGLAAAAPTEEEQGDQPSAAPEEQRGLTEVVEQLAKEQKAQLMELARVQREQLEDVAGAIEERKDQIVELAADRGEELLDLAQQQQEQLKELANKQRQQLREVAGERGEQLAGLASDIAREQRERLAELAQEQGEQLAELAEERGLQLAGLARERARVVIPIVQAKVQRGAKWALPRVRRGLWYSWGRARATLGRYEIPKAWRPTISKKDLRLVYRGPASRVYVQEKESPELPCRVALKVADKDAPEARNEIRMLRRLRASGNVAAYLGKEELERSMCVLMEAADSTLYEYLQAYRDRGRKRMSLRKSLPILVDLLRGLRDLEEQGIVHGDISERNVLMKDGRPLIADFGAALALGEEAGDRSGMRFGSGSKILSQIARMPPETRRGAPTAPSNSVYQVGIIFANMCLGYVPQLRTLFVKFGSDVQDIVLLQTLTRGSVESTIDKVQGILRSAFRVERDPEFADLTDDAREILAGMLAMKAADRWTAAQALERVLEMAERRGIEVPPERTALVLDLPWQRGSD